MAEAGVEVQYTLAAYISCCCKSQIYEIYFFPHKKEQTQSNIEIS